MRYKVWTKRTVNKNERAASEKKKVREEGKQRKDARKERDTERHSSSLGIKGQEKKKPHIGNSHFTDEMNVVSKNIQCNRINNAGHSVIIVLLLTIFMNYKVQFY